MKRLSAIDFFGNFGRPKKREWWAQIWVPTAVGRARHSVRAVAVPRIERQIERIATLVGNRRHAGSDAPYLPYSKTHNFVKFLYLIPFGKAVAMIRPIDMKTITMVYPGFQMLPKGLKQLLVESESFFFEEETTFFRRDRESFVPSRVNAQLVRGQRLSKTWKN